MAARDKKTGKAYRVPKLELGGEPESFQIRNKLGEKRQNVRKMEAARALRISPPTY